MNYCKNMWTLYNNLRAHVISKALCLVVQNVGAYVVGDHYTAPWEFPASKKYIDKGYNYMQTLLAVLTEQGVPL